MTALARAAVVRLGAAALVVWGAVTCAFVVLHLVPGDPLYAVVGANALLDAEQREQIRRQYGLDRPLTEQYLGYLGRLVRGDLGDSYQLQQPVADVLREQLGPTVQLAAAATVVAVLIAVVVAVGTSGTAAWPRRVSALGELLVLSTPAFWLGIMLLTVFSFRLGWLPVAGDGDPRALVLPVLTMALPIAAVLSQVLRDGLQETLAQPFVRTARARGLSEVAVRSRHALRHATLPALTLAGWFTGSLLGGAVVVENVFARPGIGRLTLAAVSGRDLPMVQGVVALSAVVFVVTGIVVELLSTVVDPRLRRTTGVSAA